MFSILNWTEHFECSYYFVQLLETYIHWYMYFILGWPNVAYSKHFQLCFYKNFPSSISNCFHFHKLWKERMSYTVCRIQFSVFSNLNQYFNILIFLCVANGKWPVSIYTNALYILFLTDESVLQYLTRFFPQSQGHWLWLPIFEFEVGLTAGVTGQQRILTPPRHLILPSHLSEVPVALHSIL
jgi:hypothetical protein